MVGTDSDMDGEPDGPAILNVLGVEITGNFVIEQSTNTFGERIIRLGMIDVGLSLGGVVTVSEGTGLFLIAPDGIAGELSADVALNIPGVTFEGSFGIAINTTSRAVQSTIMLANDTLSIDLPSGPYLRVEGLSITLGIGGVVLSGDVAFEQVTEDGPDGLPNTADDVSETRILFNNVSLDLGGDVLRIFDGSGALVIVPDAPGGALGGLAGKLSVSVELNLPGVALGGTVDLVINQTEQAVARSFTLGGQAIDFDLPTGQFLRVQLTGADFDGDGNIDPAFLEIVGQRLEADLISFEQTRIDGPDGLANTADDVQILRVVASGVGLNINAGDPENPILEITDGTALIEITPAGLAGSVSASAMLRCFNRC